ncbi:MAG: family 10 glycosylhydrolase [Flavobacteriaceae bacterium]|nr:family 10 glycosylhydrolase [Flavobacteriaceae bacterium]
MKFITKTLILFSLFIYFQSTFSQTNQNREFRGVWVATVENIDWPSSKKLSTDQQQKEIIQLLDRFKQLNFNAIIFQIRPSADAFYNSKYEPWSSYLTGTNDKSPKPYYDPLAFIIHETHKRGMEFHAWLNPYRAVVNYKKFQSNPYKLTYDKSEWFINYGKNKYFNPGIPGVRKYTNKIVADIVQNYDIDAVHFDDYFYPYKIKDTPFSDALAFKEYGGNYYPNNLEDWRRNNVNIIIEELHTTIKTIKPWVQFGISPFGVWRNKNTDPKGSNTQAGQTNYDDLYADILLWLKNDWLDYILPQVYWHIGHKKADYKTIVTWWAENNFNTNLYIGQGIYKLNGKKDYKAWKKTNPTEIEKQLNLNKTIPQIQGSVFFSAKVFLKDPLGVNQILKNRYYQNPILPPSVNHNVNFIPEPVYNIKMTKQKNKNIQIFWESIPENKEKEAVKFLVFLFDKDEKVDTNNSSKIISLTGENQITIRKKDFQKGATIIIQAVSRNNNLSKASYFKK